MTMNKRYKVIAKMTTYLYAHVDAEYAVDAIAIAKEMDGGEFIPLNQGIRAGCKVMKTRYAKPFEGVQVDDSATQQV